MQASALDTIDVPTRALRGPALLLRVEGLAIAAAATVTYHRLDLGWLLFVVLILVPDIGLLGYLRGPAAGARTYNATHTLTVPLAVAGVGIVSGSHTAIAVALIWLVHIGVDRAVGFGLKYPTSLRDTHLQRLA